MRVHPHPPSPGTTPRISSLPLPSAHSQPSGAHAAPVTPQCTSRDEPRALEHGLPRRVVTLGGLLGSLTCWPPDTQAATASKVCLINTSPKAKANANARIPKAQLGFGAEPLFVSRIIKGSWPAADGASPALDFGQLIQAGVTSFDTGDVGAGRAEALVGGWLAEQPEERKKVQVLTRISVTNASEMAGCSRETIDQALSSKVLALGSPPDMVQLYWGSWDQPRWLDAVQWLADAQGAGQFKHLGLVNFESEQLQQVLDAGVRVAAVQAPLSLVDRRVDNHLLPLCRDASIPLIAQSPLAGGLITAKFLGVPQDNAPGSMYSLQGKYSRILRDNNQWGWLVDTLLPALTTVANKYGVAVEAVATRWVLDQPGCAAVVRPVRGGLESLPSTFSFKLDQADRALINEVLSQSTQPAGRVWDLERGAGTFW